MPISIKQSSWKGVTTPSVKTSTGWKNMEGYVKVGSAWKPLNEPGMGGMVTLERKVTQGGQLVALGFQKMNDDATYPPYGSVNPNPLIVNASGGKMQMITNNIFTAGGVTDIASLLATYDQNATTWTTMLVNGKPYQRADFQLSNDPNTGMWTMVLFGTDFFAGFAPGAVVSVRFV